MTTPDVVVTGASGYIGRHLVRRLAEDGWRVSAIMRRPPADALPPSVDVVLTDVCDFTTLHPHFATAAVVVHLACLPMQPSSADPRGAFAVNALGTFNVLEACRQHEVKRVVVTSTAYVYGNPQTVPISENHPTLPTDPYGASKLAGDAFTLAYGMSDRLTTVLLRIFNVFGAAVGGEPRRTVEALFAENGRAGLPVTINGNPRDARDFVHIIDVIDAVMAAVSLDVTGIYNIGSGHAYSLYDLARAAQITDAMIDFGTDHADSPPVVCRADISKASRDLGFEVRTNVLDFVAAVASVQDRPG